MSIIDILEAFALAAFGFMLFVVGVAIQTGTVS
jgi:hypothetical protein